MKMGENKQLKVDNWGVFFLQRLQLFFSKTDYCDLTLQFEGNVQLKVHRLVINACTDYFEHLELHSPDDLEENVLLMPPQLQADVIVPIVNFMYTGMLDFPYVIFEKLYRAAEIMKITVLVRLLDSQKRTTRNLRNLKQKKPSKNQETWLNMQVGKRSVKQEYDDLPATLPGRKLPVWKRRTAPTTSSPKPASTEKKWYKTVSSSPSVSSTVSRVTPAPTRFEWPDEDLPSVDMLDTDFGDISYTSKPLLTREEELRSGCLVERELDRRDGAGKRSGALSDDEEESLRNGEDEEPKSGRDAGALKRKPEVSEDVFSKKIRFTETDNEATISIISSGNSPNIDPSKLVSQVLKKYPHLVKKKKNIKLKILTKTKDAETDTSELSADKSPEKLPGIETIQSSKVAVKKSRDGPWYCDRCRDSNDKPIEFVLYYLFRKHMTDVHHYKFGDKICKYCGSFFPTQDLLMYHLCIKHNIKPPAERVFPVCDLCPFVAMSKTTLTAHRLKHKPGEAQCNVCKVTFDEKKSLDGHVRVTAHTGRGRRNQFDCRYCLKTSRDANNLMSHIRAEHYEEGERDGVVCLEDFEEVEHKPEASGEGSQETSKDKVNIISDVKLPTNHEESETITGVPGGISASELGLLDIVVLDDNRQYIVHNQGDSEGQQEYILPDMGQAGHHEVISGQTIVPSGQISSTDDLVMVLTDHDYQDETGQALTSSDNSNIVVLYSHPVDGQQGQYISQGNLLVNSEGLIEIRNGAAIATTTASQFVVSNTESSQIETIEMIQREINEHKSMKQEPYYGEQQKTEGGGGEVRYDQHAEGIQYVEETEVAGEGRETVQTVEEEQVDGVHEVSMETTGVEEEVVGAQEASMETTEGDEEEKMALEYGENQEANAEGEGEGGRSAESMDLNESVPEEVNQVHKVEEVGRDVPPTTTHHKNEETEQESVQKAQDEGDFAALKSDDKNASLDDVPAEEASFCKETKKGVEEMEVDGKIGSVATDSSEVEDAHEKQTECVAPDPASSENSSSASDRSKTIPESSVVEKDVSSAQKGVDSANTILNDWDDTDSQQSGPNRVETSASESAENAEDIGEEDRGAEEAEEVREESDQIVNNLIDDWKDEDDDSKESKK